MDHLRQIEEDLAALSSESKRKYPEVKDATDRALSTLKIIREMYVAEMMRKGGNKLQVTKFPQSSDISAPYILACNYADASPKLILMALNGMQLLLNYEIIPAADAKNILRVLGIQAATGRPDSQLKLLQILLQLANSLKTSPQYLTEPTVCTFLQLSLQLCDGRNSVSVSSTAFATARQILALVMDGVRDIFVTEMQSIKGDGENTTLHLDQPRPDEATASLSLSAQLFIKDVILFIRGFAGEWLRGVTLSLTHALDLVYDAISGWKELFQVIQPFKAIVKDYVCPALCPLLKGLQADFLTLSLKNGLPSAAALSSRVVRIARTLLLDFVTPNDMLEEFDLIVTLMVHVLQPDRSWPTDPTPTGGLDGSVITNSGTSSIMSRLNAPMSAVGTVNKALPTLSSNSLLTIPANDPCVKDSLSGTNQIPSHPAGICLETLLSFFLSDVPERLAKDGQGCKALGRAMAATLISTSSLLTNCFGHAPNVREFDNVVRGSQLITLLEGVLTGAEADVKYVVRSVHEHLTTSASIEAPEVLVLSFQVMQVVARFLLKCTLYSMPENSTKTETLLPQDLSQQRKHNILFFDDDLFLNTSTPADGDLKTHLRIAMTYVCDNSVEAVQQACSSLLSHSDYSGVVRRSLGVMSELALTAGFMNLQRSCGIVIGSLCKFTVPVWHAQELHEGNEQVHGEPIRWRHIQCQVRLIQVVCVLADVIPDWEYVVDSLDQVHHHLARARSFFPGIVSDEVSPSEMEKLSLAIERFKKYTIFLCDDTLVKLIAALVALSMNTVSACVPLSFSTETRSSSTPSHGDQTHSLSISSDLAPFDSTNFALSALVDITKFNSSRLSVIWQMVTSHLRMIASLRSPSFRAAAVAATQDVVNTALEYSYEPFVHVSKYCPTFIDDDCTVHESLLRRESMSLTDDIVFTLLLPSFETAFLGRRIHRLVLRTRTDKSILQLSQEDFFSVLTAMGSVVFDDVRSDVMNGLLESLQERGHMLHAAWPVVVELIASVPMSMVVARVVERTSLVESDPRDTTSYISDSCPWPKQTLAVAFNCAKFIVDEFLDLLSLGVVERLIAGLSAFASQTHDVNISLTSVELLWKVCDCTLMKLKLSKISGQRERQEFQANAEIISSVLGLMMNALLTLSMDSRPELRNCAMNTLFAMNTANATLISPVQWRALFDRVIFPLFDKQSEKSLKAMSSNELAEAPELKKGVKMTMHHSRDTVHKQWSETRALALRGLSGVIKVCTRLLLMETWFRNSWDRALDVCKLAIQSACDDQEVALAGVDVLFVMLKTSRVGGNVTNAQEQSKDIAKALKQQRGNRSTLTELVEADRTSVHHGFDAIELGIAVETARQELWQKTWITVEEASKFSVPSLELALHIVNNLKIVYDEGKEGEFRYSENTRVLLQITVMLARPRMLLHSQSDSNRTPTSNKAVETQLQRAIMTLLKTVRIVDRLSACTLANVLCEICFSRHLQIRSPIHEDQVIYLAPCPEKIRSEAGKRLIELMQNLGVKVEVETHENRNNEFPKGCAVAVVETVFRRFVHDICGPSLEKRRSVQSSSSHDSAKNIFEHDSDSIGSGTEVAVQGPTMRDREENSMRGFLSTLGMMWSGVGSDISQTKLLPEDSAIAPLQTLNLQRCEVRLKHTPSDDDLDGWVGVNYLRTGAEIEVLLHALDFDKDNSTISHQVWDAITTSLACCLTPWKSSEVQIAQISPAQGGYDEAETLAFNGEESRVVEFLEVVGRPEFQQRLTSPAHFLKVVDIVSSCGRLQLDVLVHCVKAHSKTSTKSSTVNPGRFVEGSIEQQLKFLSSIGNRLFTFITSSRLSLEPKRRSLDGYLRLCIDMAALCADDHLKSSIPQLLFEECNKFWIALKYFTSSIDMLPTQFSCLSGLRSSAEILEEWLRVVSTPASEYLMNGMELGNKGSNDFEHPAAKLSPNSQTTSASDVWNKGHLLLILPMAVRLGSCDQPSLRETVSDLLGHIDLFAFVASFQDIWARSQALEMENVALRSELFSVKSAASLPF